MLDSVRAGLQRRGFATAARRFSGVRLERVRERGRGEAISRARRDLATGTMEGLGSTGGTGALASLQPEDPRVGLRIAASASNGLQRQAIEETTATEVSR